MSLRAKRRNPKVLRLPKLLRSTRNDILRLIRRKSYHTRIQQRPKSKPSQLAEGRVKVRLKIYLNIINCSLFPIAKLRHIYPVNSAKLPPVPAHIHPVFPIVKINSKQAFLHHLKSELHR